VQATRLDTENKEEWTKGLHIKWHNEVSSISCALAKHIWEIRMFLSDVCLAFWQTSWIHLANQDPSLKHNWRSMIAPWNVKRHTHPTTCITTVTAELPVLKLLNGSSQRHNCSCWCCWVHYDKCHRCHMDNPAGIKYTLVVLVLKFVHKKFTFTVISHHLLKEVHYHIQWTVFPDSILGF
jgi:hypothetical protein